MCDFVYVWMFVSFLYMLQCICLLMHVCLCQFSSLMGKPESCVVLLGEKDLRVLNGTCTAPSRAASAGET